VYFFFDESGEFRIAGRTNPDVIAGLICPDSHLDRIEDFVVERQKDWGLDELHHAELSDDQRQTVCDFISGPFLAATVVLTDGLLVTEEELFDWRLRQAGRMASDYERSLTARRGDAEAEALRNRLIKRTGLSATLSDDQFLQFGMLMPRLVLDALQAALFAYRDPPWRENWATLKWIFDGKLAAGTPAKRSAGEKLLEEIVPRIFAGDERFTLTVPDEIGDDSAHPYFAAHRLPGGEDRDVGVRDLFRQGFDFESSKDHVGLQLADIVAGVVRLAAEEPDNGAAQRAFDTLKPKLLPHYPPNYIPLRIWSVRALYFDELHRYAHLF
jgi:hypothetical protein